jgi:hypothetical protein
MFRFFLRIYLEEFGVCSEGNLEFTLLETSLSAKPLPLKDSAYFCFFISNCCSGEMLDCLEASALGLRGTLGGGA